jgi:hypothetical protein
VWLTLIASKIGVFQMLFIHDFPKVWHFFIIFFFSLVDAQAGHGV